MKKLIFTLVSLPAFIFSLENSVDILLKKMTLEEKIGQMLFVEEEHISNKNDISKYKLGGLFFGENAFPIPNTPAEWIKRISFYQNKAAKTRLKLPLFIAANIYHGNNKLLGSVIFPHNIGIGATFDENLAKKSGEITAKETLPIGINFALLPSLAVIKDIRWGQTYESYSENHEMVSLFISNFLMGLQGENIGKKYSLLACIRGFPGEGAIEKGLHYGDIKVDEKELIEVHLKPFETAIKAGAKAIMLSYASWKGEKILSSTYLVKDILRKRLNFNGVILSEKNAVFALDGNYEEQVKTALNTGIDIFLVSVNYRLLFDTLRNLVKKGDIKEERINESVKRILSLKYEYNIFYEVRSDFYSKDITRIGSKEHREVAKEIVRKGVVLFKNDGILPLTNVYQKVLVAGKNADDVGNQCGGWTIYKYGSWQRWLHHTNVPFIEGKSIFHSLKESLDNVEIVLEREPKKLKEKEYDLAIVVIGERPYAEKSGYRKMLTLDYSDFLYPDPYVLDYRDSRVVRKIYDAKIPMVVVFITGRPLFINDILKKSKAFIVSFLPGTEGDGVVDVLTGRYRPQGKLPVRWPKNMWQIPIKYNKREKPLFPFAYGLSY